MPALNAARLDFVFVPVRTLEDMRDELLRLFGVLMRRAEVGFPESTSLSFAHSLKVVCDDLCETIGAKTPIGEQDPHVEVKVSVGRDGVVYAFFSQSPDKGLWGNCFVEQAPFFRLVCEFLGITDLSKGVKLWIAAAPKETIDACS